MLRGYSSLRFGFISMDQTRTSFWLLFGFLVSCLFVFFLIQKKTVGDVCMKRVIYVFANLTFLSRWEKVCP